MQNLPEDIVLKKNLYRDHLIEVLEGDGDYWFQCRSVHGGEEEADQAGYASPGAAERAGKAFIDRKIETDSEVSNRWLSRCYSFVVENLNSRSGLVSDLQETNFSD